MRSHGEVTWREWCSLSRSGILLTLLLLCTSFATSQAKAPPETIETMATWTARLPCRVRNVARPVLVLWFRRRDNHPFYSYDARGGNLTAGSGREHDQHLGPRSRFVVVLDGYRQHNDNPTLPPIFPGRLELRDLTREDAGGYTCRVDFLNAPTQTHRLRLVVYEQASSAVVVDGLGRPLSEGPGGVLSTGPLNLSAPLLLTCIVSGGWPTPTVSWERAGVPLQSTTSSVVEGSVASRIYLPSLRPEDHLTRLACTATNNNLTDPLITYVTIDMNIAPSVVLLRGATRAVRSGSRQEVKCLSSGSRPPARLTWDLEGAPDWSPLEITQTVTRAGWSESRLVWMTQARDHGRRLTCTASNPRNAAFTLANHTTLTVLHAPIVTLTIGRGLDPLSIKEGADVYFTCSVQANPPPDTLTFYHEGEEVSSGRNGERGGAGGVLVTGDSLVLQKVTRRGSGRYACRASNTYGSHASNAITLTVLYLPECVGSRQVLSVTPGDNVTLKCLVNATPPPSRFSWALNTTKGPAPLPYTQYEWAGNISALRYTSPRNLKKEVLLCSAENQLGRMLKPCVTTIMAAGVPERVERCIVVKKMVSSLLVSCTPGHDGGLTQTFLALVEEPGSGKVVSKIHSASPNFTVRGLASGGDYVVKVLAYNSKGRSHPYMLDTFSLKVAENRMDTGDDNEDNWSSVILVLGVILAIVLTLTILVVAAGLRCRRYRVTGHILGHSTEDDLNDFDVPGPRVVIQGNATTTSSSSSPSQVKFLDGVEQDATVKHMTLEVNPRNANSLDYMHLESKTSESLYSSCTSPRCGMVYSTESAVLLSSSPSSCSATTGLLSAQGASYGGPGATFGGPGATFGGPGATFDGPRATFGGTGATFGGTGDTFGGPGGGKGGTVSLLYGSLERPILGSSWGEYSPLHPLPQPPRSSPQVYEPEEDSLCHVLPIAVTSQPSESFV